MRRVPIHAIAAVSFCLAHLTACVVVYGFLIEGVPNRFSFRLQHLLTVYFAMDVLVYGSIVGVWSAVRSSQLSRERELAATRLRAGLVEAKLDGLRAQLNPHFLFNALNATATMALRGENEAVVRMLERLGGLLRVSVDPDLPREISLDRELAILDQYLGIQEVRFGDRLTVLREIEPEAREALVPAMILQPLVENAIQHGVARRPGAGRIRIRAQVTGKWLRLEVHDDGFGWACEAGAGLPVGQTGEASRIALESPNEDPARRGIGLNNTVSRLEYLYGSEFRLERLRSSDGGAAVIVHLPRTRLTTADSGSVMEESRPRAPQHDETRACP
jgi:LytS/YehU family sensor histidine kinase